MSNGYSGEEVSVALQPLNCSFTLYRSLNDVLKKPKKSKPDPRQLTLVKRFYSDFYCSPISPGLRSKDLSTMHYMWHALHLWARGAGALQVSYEK